MSGKLKKAIIAVVVVLLVAVGGLVAFTMLSKISTTTVYDLRLVEYGTNTEIFEKEVYLTAEEDNKFDVGLKVIATAMTNFVVASSDETVAKVSVRDNHYVVTYYKVGKVTISATAPDNASVNDSFVLTVKESYPMNFEIPDKKEDEGNKYPCPVVEIYADNKEYLFDFIASSINKDSPVNNDTISVLDDYDKNVFESISIDASNSKLVIKAKQNVESTVEYITIVCKTNDTSEEKAIVHFLVGVEVHGNYISDMQLVLSTRPNFDSSIYVCGDGELKEGEQRVDGSQLVFSANVNIVYTKVRVRYTNGEYFDVTRQALASGNDNGTIKPPPSLSYYQIKISQTSSIKFIYSTSGQNTIERTFTFYFYDTDSTTYNRFLENNLYRKVTKEDGSVIFEYVHWDERYKRDDAVTKNGEIIGFKNGNPACGE